MRNITDIIRELVERIPTVVIGERLDVIDDTTKFWTCDVGYASVGGTLGGLPIIEVGSNYIIVQGTGLSLANADLKTPTYKHGTIIKVNIENQLRDRAYEEVYPMVYFPETTSKVERFRSIDIRDQSADVRLIFAKRYQEDWNTDQDETHIINPMLALYERFKKVVESDPMIKQEGIRWRESQYPILGTYVNDKGYKNGWFDDRVGGLVVDVNLEILKGFVCNCCGCGIPE